MTWFKVDDTLNGHPKVRRAGLHAMGLWTVAGSWASQQLTDGFVPDWFADTWPQGRKHARALVDAELWDEAEGGWVFRSWTSCNPTRAQVQARQGKQSRSRALHNDQALVAAIRRRDGDNCRYCGKRVNWADRKSSLGGTYDHVDPEGENTLENVVVACRGCNSSKRDRTPEQAGMPLIQLKSDSSQIETGLPSDPRPDPTRTSTPYVNRKKSDPVDNRPTPPPVDQVLADLPPADFDKGLRMVRELKAQRQGVA